MSKGVEIPNRLFFGGIRDFSTVSDLSSRLTSILAPLGAIASPLQPVIDTLTNELKGFAYADITSNNSSTLLDDSILIKAIKSLHGLQWRGSRLRVERAVENGLDKLSRERKEEAEAESERLQEETSNKVIDQTNFSLPSKLRIRKRGYEPCTEVFSTPFESTETAEAIEAKRILDLPPLKMAKEIEKKTRHRAIHIKFEEGNGTDGSFRKDTNKKSNERSNMNDIDESKKHLWEIRVGRGQEGKNTLSSSSSSSSSASSSTIAIDTISSNISSVGLVPISSDGHDLIRSSMLADTRRQLSILSSLLGEEKLAEQEYFTGKKSSIETKNKEEEIKSKDITHVNKQISISSLSSSAEVAASSSSISTGSIVQVNVPSWRALVYGEKMAQAGRTQISLADAKATVAITTSLQKDATQSTEFKSDDLDETSKSGGPIGKFLSIYKSTVPLHVDPSFTFSFGSEESTGDGIDSVKRMINKEDDENTITTSNLQMLQTDNDHRISPSSTTISEGVKKNIQLQINPAERWLSHRPDIKKKKEGKDDGKSKFPGTTTFSSTNRPGTQQQKQGQGQVTGGQSHSGTISTSAVVPSLSPQSSFNSLLMRAGSFFGNSNPVSISANKEFLKKDFRSKQRQQH